MQAAAARPSVLHHSTVCSQYGTGLRAPQVIHQSLHWRPIQRQQSSVVCNSTPEQPSSTSSDTSGNRLRKGFNPKPRASQKKPEPQLDLSKQTIFGGGDQSEEAWREIDKKLNKYPGYRTFTAIGSGGEEFKAAMVKAVESVVGTVHMECISQRPSSKGQYISVKIGPVPVQNPEQVIQVFANMKADERLKWFM